MKQRKEPPIFASVKILIAEGRFHDAASLIHERISRIRDWDEWSDLLEIFNKIPEEYQLSSPTIAIVYAEILARNGELDHLFLFTSNALEIFDGEVRAAILLSRSSGLSERNDFLGTLRAIEDALPFLTGESKGRAFGRMGLTLFQLGIPWEAEFAQGRNLLAGRNLGLLLLNLGYCLNENHRSQEARAVWIDALPLLKSDPYSLAWLRYNLGTSHVQDFEIVEAERHFLEGKRLSGNPKSFSMRPSILGGLANVRKARGEWSRAEFNYREAFRTATDSFDRVFALTGLVRTLLLAGRAPEANETLELELNPEDANDLNIQIARALVCLHLNNLPRASAALETITTPIVGTYQWLERLCRAELARRHGQFTEAVQWLEGNPTHTLHMREEVRQWPELFALAKAAGLPIPEPLEYVQGSTVQVRARGVLHVAVNDRGVSIPPTGRVGELLVFLLEHEGEAPLDVILEAFYPNAVGQKERARARKMVWEHANTLRELLGWQDAVIALGGAYQLDPQTTWHYDIREARALKMFNGEFLAGVYSEWALEVGQQLAGLAVDSDAGVHLN
jgi:tetratricopeptide (TPR) repeat protein